MTNAAEWEGGVGRIWAAEQARTDRSFGELTTILLARIADLPGSSIVDIGCGAGELSLAIAAARRNARVLGIDISPDLVAAAAVRGSRVANCVFALADAATWQPDRGAPDLYVSRHGVMFFADPVGAFAHLGEVAAPDAQLVFSCFRSPEENPWATELSNAVGGAAPADPHAPGPFAFADRDRVTTILSDAGWRDVHFEAVDFVYRAGEGDDPVGDALSYLSRIGPAARALRELPEAERGPALVHLRQVLEARRAGDRVVFPAAAWIVNACR